MFTTLAGQRNRLGEHAHRLMPLPRTRVRGGQQIQDKRATELRTCLEPDGEAAPDLRKSVIDVTGLGERTTAHDHAQRVKQGETVLAGERNHGISLRPNRFGTTA